MCNVHEDTFQAVPSDVLLNKIKMLLSIISVLFKCRHAVSLKRKKKNNLEPSEKCKVQLSSNQSRKLSTRETLVDLIPNQMLYVNIKRVVWRITKWMGS